MNLSKHYFISILLVLTFFGQTVVSTLNMSSMQPMTPISQLQRITKNTLQVHHANHHMIQLSSMTTQHKMKQGCCQQGCDGSMTSCMAALGIVQTTTSVLVQSQKSIGHIQTIHIPLFAQTLYRPPIIA